MSLNAEVHVLVNAASGAGASTDVVIQLEDIFRRNGVKANIVVLSAGESIEAAARRLLAGNPRAIVAGGGDGTVNAVASVLVGTQTALGLLPLGTLNHFAKDLGIPLSVEDAAKVVVAGRVRKVDVGEVNGRFFVNNSSLGLYPQLVRSRQQQQRLGRGKWPAFAWALATVLRRHPFLHLQLEIDGKKVSLRTPLVFIGNNRYHLEGLKLGERDRLDGGKLSLCILRRKSRLGLLQLALNALLHRLRKGQDLETMMLDECQIDSHRSRLHVATDGEVSSMDAPLHYRVRPRALGVLA
jgi:diacylglycerol kinase family enzyme